MATYFGSVSGCTAHDVRHHFLGHSSGDEHQVALSRAGTHDLHAEAGQVVARCLGGDHLDGAARQTEHHGPNGGAPAPVVEPIQCGDADSVLQIRSRIRERCSRLIVTLYHSWRPRICRCTGRGRRGNPAAPVQVQTVLSHIVQVTSGWAAHLSSSMWSPIEAGCVIRAPEHTGGPNGQLIYKHIFTTVRGDCAYETKGRERI
jgi:hypothetical protein